MNRQLTLMIMRDKKIILKFIKKVGSALKNFNIYLGFEPIFLVMEFSNISISLIILLQKFQLNVILRIENLITTYHLIKTLLTTNISILIDYDNFCIHIIYISML